MAILISVEAREGRVTKSGLEAASYGVALAASSGVEAVAVAAGALQGDGGLGAVGISRVLNHAEALADNSQEAKLVQAAAEAVGAQAVVMSHDQHGKSVAPRVAVRLNAGLVSGVTELPQNGAVKRGVFSGKAIATIEVVGDRAVYTVSPNAFGTKLKGDDQANTEAFTAETGSPRVTIKGFEASSTDGQVPLPEADLVVSAGRGLKGPENWGIVEDLARALGATTACSRPVADIGWRPHHEHVGQTGIAIRPTLYIAAGISGAIQHLAGVNQSKVIVVINTDPEAPFFKAADYGIVGDAFEVLPKLTAAVKALDN